MTEIQYKMFEYTSAVNELYRYGAAYEFLVRHRWPAATLTVFDVHGLIRDIHASPQQYLSPPATTVGSYVTCNATSCSTSANSLSIFLWYL